jgi:hypothetical protein
MSIHIYTATKDEKGIKHLNYLNGYNCFYSWDDAERYTRRAIELGANPSNIEARSYTSFGMRTDSRSYIWKDGLFRYASKDTNWTGD